MSQPQLTNLEQAIEGRKRELLAEAPYTDDLAAAGITREQWEIYLYVNAALDIADDFDAPDPKVRERYMRVTSLPLTHDEVEKARQRAEELGL